MWDKNRWKSVIKTKLSSLQVPISTRLLLSGPNLAQESIPVVYCTMLNFTLTGIYSHAHATKNCWKIAKKRGIYQILKSGNSWTHPFTIKTKFCIKEWTHGLLHPVYELWKKARRQHSFAVWGPKGRRLKPKGTIVGWGSWEKATSPWGVL